MKYLVMEIQTNTDGTVGNVVFAYSDRAQAEQKYHTILAAAAVSALPSHAAVMLTNDGLSVAHACYHHVQEQG